MARTIVHRLALLLATLIFLELFLHVAATVSSRVDLILSPGIPLSIPDDLLRSRPNPLVPDHDASGWRNPEVLERADIVALGDSQTYGNEVAMLNAWPLLLGARIGVSAYNMAFGGFGPVEYYLLGPEAMEKRPRVIVVGIYSGNDLFDAFQRAVLTPRAPELLDGEQLTREQLLALDSEHQPLGSAWAAAREMRRGWWKTTRDQYLQPLEEHSKLWGLVRAVERVLTQKRMGIRGDSVREDFAAYAQKVAHLPTEQYFPVRGPHVATILTPLGRSTVMTLQDPRLAVGARITLRAIAGLRDLCRDDCTVIAILIPTKELIYEAEVTASGTPGPASYRDLLSAEKELWQFLRSGLDELEVAYVDLRETLMDSISKGRNPYLSDWDGHPNLVGNRVIAERIAEHPMFQQFERR